MLPRKIFENLHAVMTILMLSKQLLEKACHIFGFWPLTLSASSMMHFLRNKYQKKKYV